MMRVELPRWQDLHAHFRQGPSMAAYVRAHLAMHCCGVVAMPNTRPPVTRVLEGSGGENWSIEGYRRSLLQAGADAFDSVIVPLYLSRLTTPRMIEEGASSGLLVACKYYPPHGTTHADHGLPMDHWLGGDVLRQMEETGTVLCVHGEEHGLSAERWFDGRTNAESRFYSGIMPRLRDRHPRLRIVCEHLTTRTAVDFVRQAGPGTAATVTPQHLLYTLGHLLRGLRHSLYCLPVVKFVEDRLALRRAVTAKGQSRFFAGTDSAPHADKTTPCGCAAGCFTGGVAAAMYATAFECAGCDLALPQGRAALERFLCRNGPEFYRLPVARRTFALVREPRMPAPLATPEGPVIPLPLGMDDPPAWRLED